MKNALALVFLMAATLIAVESNAKCVLRESRNNPCSTEILKTFESLGYKVQYTPTDSENVVSYIISDVQNNEYATICNDVLHVYYKDANGAVKEVFRSYGSNGTWADAIRTAVPICK